MAVFDEKFHGVKGLTVVFPGKASLMFALARGVGEGFVTSLLGGKTLLWRTVPSSIGQEC